MCYYPNYRYVGKNESVKDQFKNQFIGNYISMQAVQRAMKREGIPYTENDFQQVPCGQCMECRLNHSKEWAYRCIKEAEQFQYNYFITLTYDDDHIPLNQIYNTETGEIIKSYYYNQDKEEKITLNGLATLKKEDTQKFIKDLRRYYKYHLNHENIRFFLCGEYGEKTHRPHYHAIIFNLPIEDLIYLKQINTIRYYTSEIIQKIWGKGNIIITEVNWDTCAYTARYIMKKQTGKGEKKHEEKYKQVNNNDNNIMCNEFVNMSRRPGIAENYFRLHSENIYKYDTVIYKKHNNIIKLKPPRYYDKLFDIENHEELEKIKKQRNIKAKAIMDLTKQKTNLETPDIMLMKKENFEKRWTNTRKF